MAAKLCRFYGWPPSEVEKLDMLTACTYALAINRLEALEQLALMKVADYPHASKKDRSKIHKAVHKAAYPDIKPTPMTFEMLKRALNG